MFLKSHRHLSCLATRLQGLPLNSQNSGQLLQRNFATHISRKSFQHMPNKTVSFGWLSVKKAQGLRLDNHQIRCFRVTPKHDVPPFLWMFAKPFMKLGAIIYGRGVRKWWQSLPKDKRAHFKEVIKNSWHKILLTSGVVVGFFGYNYMSHLQETPITHRKRFIAFTPEQFKKIVDYEYESLVEQHKPNILPASDPSYTRIVRVANKLVNANQDIEYMRDTTWGAIVVDSDEKNAFVLANGHMFVMTGLLDTVKNDDQLAIILGHEMSHAILGHGAETVSFAQLLDMIIIVAMTAIWAFMPSDGIALVTQWFYHKVVQLLLDMPYSRKLETEADDVGLHLAAKACFDVRESSAFWGMMNAHSLMDDEPNISWLSTHPSHANRADYLDVIIPKAMDVRHSCKCTRLTGPDPRIEVRQFLEAVRKEVMAKKVSPPQAQVVMIPQKDNKQKL